MLTYKTVDVPAVPASKRQELDKTLCDLCGEAIVRGRGDADEVKIKHRTGCSWPEGGHGIDTLFDVCGQCFDNKLVPWMVSQGAAPRTIKWDW